MSPSAPALSTRSNSTQYFTSSVHVLLSMSLRTTLAIINEDIPGPGNYIDCIPLMAASYPVPVNISRFFLWKWALMTMNNFDQLIPWQPVNWAGLNPQKLCETGVAGTKSRHLHELCFLRYRETDPFVSGWVGFGPARVRISII